MGKKISVNWNELRKLAVNTRENAEEFEQIRKRMLEIILSIQSSWQGIDANNFITKSSSYVMQLEDETDKLLEWSNFFNRTVIKYSGGIEEGLIRVKNLKEEFNPTSDYDEVI